MGNNRTLLIAAGTCLIFATFVGCGGRSWEKEYSKAAEAWNDGDLVRARTHYEKAIRKMSGQNPDHTVLTGTVAASAAGNSDRPYTLMARVERRADLWLIQPLDGHGSSDINAPARANACIHLKEGEWRLDKGDRVPFEFLVGSGESKL